MDDPMVSGVGSGTERAASGLRSGVFNPDWIGGKRDEAVRPESTGGEGGLDGVDMGGGYERLERTPASRDRLYRTAN